MNKMAKMFRQKHKTGNHSVEAIIIDKQLEGTSIGSATSSEEELHRNKSKKALAEILSDAINTPKHEISI